MPELHIIVTWIALLGILVFYGLRILKDVRFVFAPPLISIMLICGILIKSWFDFDDYAIAALLNMDYYFMTLVYAILCMVMFSLAFEYAFAKTRNAPQKICFGDRIPAPIVAAYATCIAAMGLWAINYVANTAGGLLAYYSETHGAAADYTQISGYIHGLPNFLWAAMAIFYIMIIAERNQSLPVVILFAALLLLLAAHTFLFGNRNGIVRAVLFLGGTYVFARRPSLIKSAPVLVLIAFGILAVMIIPYIRQYTHLGSDVSISEALEIFAHQREKNDGYTYINVKDGGGHEFFFNVAAVQATWVTGTYDFGASYIYPIINFIPRSIWPGKPYEINFGVNIFDLSYFVTGWWAGEGAAISALGHSFVAFSWFGSLVWAVIGYWSGTIFGRAWAYPGFMNLGALISCFIALVFWGTQSFSAFFFAWFFTYMPFFGLSVIGRFFFTRVAMRHPPQSGKSPNMSPYYGYAASQGRMV